MAIEDKKISGFTEVNDVGINNETQFALSYGGQNYKISLINLMKRIVGKVGDTLRSIGTNTAGSIVTVDAEQTQTNKRFTNPKINSNTEVTATSEELNRCKGLTNTIPGLFSSVNQSVGNIETRMSEMEEFLDNIYPTEVLYRAIIRQGASGVEIELSPQDILNAAGLDEKFEINHRSVLVSCGEDSGSKIVFGDPQDIGVSYIDSPNSRLSKVQIGGLTSGRTYVINITFSLIGA